LIFQPVASLHSDYATIRGKPSWTTSKGEKYCATELEPRPIGHPACSQSLYRLHYLGPENCFSEHGWRTHLSSEKMLSFGYNDRLCGLVVRVLGYRSGGPGSISGTTRKKIVVGLERGPLSLVSTTEELLDRKVAAPV
jgi:hypothetical protein